MSRTLRFLTIALVSELAGCGLETPDKHPLIPYEVKHNGDSTEGLLENALIGHIRCEIQKALWDTYNDFKQQWLLNWGTSVELTLSFEDQSGLTPGASLITPFNNAIKILPTAQGGNVVTNQFFSFGVGASATANATRTETIQFTYTNWKLLGAVPTAHAPKPTINTSNGNYFLPQLYDPTRDTYSWPLSDVPVNPVWKYLVIATDKTGQPAVDNRQYVRLKGADGNYAEPEDSKTRNIIPVAIDTDSGYPTGTTFTFTIPKGTNPPVPCVANGGMIESDLKIGQFIRDKGTVARWGNTSNERKSWAPFTTFQETETFIATYGANATPQWKFVRVTADTSGTLLSATRTNTNTLIITLGPIATPATQNSPAELAASSSAQQKAASQAVAISNQPAH